MTAPNTRKYPENISDAINTISYRIEKTETDFIGHLQKVETKLEQIADLARTVAVLQQQANHQHDQISEIRSQHQDQMQKYEQTVVRLHSRVDEMSSQIRDRFELANREETYKINAVAEKTDTIESEFKKWLNRGIGAWAIITILSSVVLGSFYRWIDDIEAGRVEFAKQSNSSNVVIEKHSQQIDQLVDLTKDQKTINQDIQRTLSALEIRMEQMNFNSKTTKSSRTK